MTEFYQFPKMARFSRKVIITEKIDGTNACIYIGEDGEFLTGCRTRWITPNIKGQPQTDNHGFSAWAHDNKEELLKLGPGRHFGEWWGQGIQRGYGLSEKRFSLFNTERWTKLLYAESDPLDQAVSICPAACCHVVPSIISMADGMDTRSIESCLDLLRSHGSFAAPGYMNPEGIVIFHTAANVGFKKTLDNDDVPKCQVK